MSTEPTRGHVPPLMLGRYRMLKRAANGALDAARELAQLGDHFTASFCRDAADILRREAVELRVIIDGQGEAHPICRAGCPTKDHASWGDCVRSAGIAVDRTALASGRDD